MKAIIAQIFIGVIFVPFAAAYLFFVLFGLILKRKPGGLEIENLWLAPKGAALAAFLSLLICSWLTIPGTLISMFMVRTKFFFERKRLLMIAGGCYGAILGFLVSRSHVEMEYTPFLVMEGFLFGALHIFLFKVLHRCLNVAGRIDIV